MTAPTHLDPSELGTKSYWDAAYSTERQNFAANAEDEGTIWFSDAGAEERMLSFLEDLGDEGHVHKEGDEGDKKAARFLDLGTGNGHLLFALREDEWNGEMVGLITLRRALRLRRQSAMRKMLLTRTLRFMSGISCRSHRAHGWALASTLYWTKERLMLYACHKKKTLKVAGSARDTGKGRAPHEEGRPISHNEL